MNQLNAPQGTFTLNRYPLRAKDTLRAWDAADEYILQFIAEAQASGEVFQNVLIINDSCGALATALAPMQPVVMSDSFVSHQAIRQNLQSNRPEEAPLHLIDCLQSPADFLPTTGAPADLVILKITKSLAQLEDQLHRIRPLLSENTRVLAAGMVKAIHTSTLDLFGKIIGPTHTSLAKKKARLIHCQPDLSLSPAANPFPKALPLPEHRLDIVNHASVFARDKLDIGTRFFLENMPASDEPKHIIDLGCGNGLLGIAAAGTHPNATFTMVDESFMAVASAEQNFAQNHPDRTTNFQVTDCLTGIADNCADLILNNPPFHQQNTIGDFIAVQMFKDAKRTLKTGGELLVIGNRHLGYHVKLKRLFGNCTTLASNKKFVILRCIKR
ncbi:methyltransferase [Aliamphritea spongicola]|uniref:methyltransferase n=1 Tax=Aliamphritea spongicola TaxID=707589 RepID=UPI00196B0F8B|nr:methyltransferase [Aliamphritea spongicola]MBN3563601.1 methyltransferase [Aliamphritea spongicola]